MPNLQDLIPSTPRDRYRMLIILGVLLVVLIFLMFQLPSCKRSAQPPNTTGTRLITELNAKLVEAGFPDAGFAVESERPLRFRVVGGVHTPQELEKLNELLKQLRPEGDYDVEVEIMLR